MSGGPGERESLGAEIESALEAAKHLIEHGVPIFIAKPSKIAGRWNPRGGNGRSGYNIPKGWQKSEPDLNVLDVWRKHYKAGNHYALCAVMGHIVDGFDVDPRNGGKTSVKALRDAGDMPVSYGKARTPNGGVHHLIASLGVRSRDGAWPGIDLKAGVSGEGGFGFLFIAPTRKATKGGEIGCYEWERAPDLALLEIVGDDGSGRAVRERVDELRKPVWEGESWEGDDYDGLPDAFRRMADQALSDVVDWWTERFAEAVEWDETVRDAKGRGWEALARDWAWTVASWVACPWSGLDLDHGFALHDKVLPEEIAADEKCRDKFGRGTVANARKKPIAPPPWDGFGVVIDEDVEGDVLIRRHVNVSNDALSFRWLIDEAGTRGLSSLFKRARQVVCAVRIGEEGYKPPKSEKDDDGPAQIWPLTASGIAAEIDAKYAPYVDVFNTMGVKKGQKPGLFPAISADRALHQVHTMPNIRPLRGVTHTPTVSAGGDILTEPGYHEPSGMLFLPTEGLDSVAVPDEPTRAELRRAVALVEKMLADFPWDSDHDKANYICMLLTPLLRAVCPPPYKMGVIHAHQAGSGKSLLGFILRTLHGGVMRGDPPKSDDELRKQITAVLYSTTAPVVQLDNVRHLESSLFDMLLTSADWGDRILGSTTELTLRNDRLWIATGNNVSLGGDLVRRVMWASIDPNQPNPEARTDFQIQDLKGWVAENRGEILGALLTMIRAWVVEGRPIGGSYGADDFGRWLGVCQGVLDVAGIPGSIDDPSTRQVTEVEEVDEWAAYLGLVEDLVRRGGEERFPGGRFTSKDLAEAMLEPAPDGMRSDSAISIGKWLNNRRGRWSGGRSVRLDRKVNKIPQWVISVEPSLSQSESGR